MIMKSISLSDRVKKLWNSARGYKKDEICYEKPYSMDPEGFYGSVFVDNRGHGILKVCLGVFLILGIVVLTSVFFIVNKEMNKTAEIPECIQSLSDSVERNIPKLTDLIELKDESIVTHVSSDNETIYKINSSEKAMELMRVSDGLSIDDMAACYAQGFSNQTLERMCQILKGSWWLTSNHGASDTLKLKYSDFNSKSAEDAISNAMAIQGFKNNESCIVLSSGKDKSGNTYKYGSVKIDSVQYYWRVATCPVTDVYAFEDLPETGCYVGVTLSNAAFMDLAEASN